MEITEQHIQALKLFNDKQPWTRIVGEGFSWIGYKLYEEGFIKEPEGGGGSTNPIYNLTFKGQMTLALNKKD
jgi:hypothetical protein